MKKILFLLLLIPLTVLGNEELSLEHEELNIMEAVVRIVVSEKSLSIDKRLNSQLLYGNEPSTYYVDFYLPHKYNMYNAKTKKIEENSSSAYIMESSSKAKYEVIPTENEIILRFGEENYFYPEKDTIVMSYDLDFDVSLENLSFPIYYSDYNTKELTFSLYIPKIYNEKNILFSLDNKNFSKELEGLSLTDGEEKGIIYGKYNKKMSEGETLYLLITSINISSKTINFKLLAVVIALILLIFIIGGVYYFRKKKRLDI